MPKGVPERVEAAMGGRGAGCGGFFCWTVTCRPSQLRCRRRRSGLGEVVRLVAVPEDSVEARGRLCRGLCRPGAGSSRVLGGVGGGLRIGKGRLARVAAGIDAEGEFRRSAGRVVGHG